ncbi:hypothetical protein BSKO_07272 [Bryopsis sp. KO-2023]|nr:hypothetical protein BSKO_07272 [Bryopsis sp. KO-2023]
MHPNSCTGGSMLDKLNRGVEVARDKTVGWLSDRIEKVQRRGDDFLKTQQLYYDAAAGLAGEEEEEEEDGDEETGERMKSTTSFPPLHEGPLSFYDDFRVVNGVPAFLLLHNEESSESSQQDVTATPGVEDRKGEPGSTDPSKVTCCSLSSDGRRLVSGYSDGSVRVWSLDHGTLEAIKRGLFEKHVCDVSFHLEHDRVVVSCDRTGQYHHWDLETGDAQFVRCDAFWLRNGSEKKIVGKPFFALSGTRVVFPVGNVRPIGGGGGGEVGTLRRQESSVAGFELYVYGTEASQDFLGMAVINEVQEGFLTSCTLDGNAISASFMPQGQINDQSTSGWTHVWPNFAVHPNSFFTIPGGFAAWVAPLRYIVAWDLPEGSSQVVAKVFEIREDNDQIPIRAVIRDAEGGSICWCKFITEEEVEWDSDDLSMGTAFLACCIAHPGNEVCITLYNVQTFAPVISMETGITASPSSWPLYDRASMERTWENEVTVKSINTTADLSWLGIFSGSEGKGMILDSVHGVAVLQLDIPGDLLAKIGSDAGIVMGLAEGNFAIVGSDGIMVMSPRVRGTNAGALVLSLAYENKAPADRPLSCKFSMDGRFLGLLQVGASLMTVWDLDIGTTYHVELAEKNEMAKRFVAFALSSDGDFLATLSLDRAVRLWDVSGDTCLLVEVVGALSESRDIMPSITMTFSQGLQGNMALVVCDECGDLTWFVSAPSRRSPRLSDAQLGADRGLEFPFIPWLNRSKQSASSNNRGIFKQSSMHTESGAGKHSCRFSDDGTIGVLMPDPKRVDIWDLAEQVDKNTVEYEVSPGYRSHVSVGSSMCMDGVFSVVGTKGKETDLVFCRPETTKEELQENMTKVANHLLLSENGEWVLTDGFHSMYDQEGQLKPLQVYDGRSCKALHLINTSNPSLRKTVLARRIKPGSALVVSPDGRRIACAGKQNRIRIWTAHAADGLIPNYQSLVVDKRAHDGNHISKLLDSFGPALFNLLDPTGLSLMMQAVYDLNFPMLKFMVKWGLKKVKVRFRCIGGGDMTGLSSNPASVEEHTNAINLAIARRSPDFVRFIIDAVFLGMAHEHEKAMLFHESIVEIGKDYPTILCDVLGDERIFVNIGTIQIPETVFSRRHNPRIIDTDDRLVVNPQAIQNLWSERTADVEGFRVPSRVRSIAFPEAAQIGIQGLLSSLLVIEAPTSAFASPTVKHIISYKWSTYAEQLMFIEFVHFGIMLLTFTVYTWMMGRSDWPRRRDMLRDPWGQIAIALLFASAFLALLNLLREFKQFFIQLQGTGWTGLKYWTKSAWNWVEVLTYILLIIIIPVVHFAERPNDNVGLSTILAVASIMMWWKVLYYMRSFKRTGPLVIIIGNIIQDMATFLVLSFLVLFGFGVAFFVLYRHIRHADISTEDLSLQDEKELDNIMTSFGDLPRTLATMFAFMLGDFDLEVIYNINRDGVPSPNKWTGVFFFVVYMFAMAVILLNLLIAVMGDSFDRIKNMEETEFLKARAMAIDDVETMLSEKKKRKIRESIKPFIHVIEPLDKIGATSREPEWQGKVLDLQRRFSHDLKSGMTQANDALEELAKVTEENAGALKTMLEMGGGHKSFRGLRGLSMPRVLEEPEEGESLFGTLTPSLSGNSEPVSQPFEESLDLDGLSMDLSRADS